MRIIASSRFLRRARKLHEPHASMLRAALRRFAADGIRWHLRATAESLVMHLPIEMLGEAGSGWPADKEGIAPLVALITFRHDALTALAQP